MTGLDVDVVVVGVPSPVGPPPGSGATAPLSARVDDELDVTTAEPRDPLGEPLTTNVIGGPPVDGTTTRMEAPGVRSTSHATTVKAPKPSAMRVE